MGVDYEYCKNCDGCFNSECFRQCSSCFDQLSYCDSCDEDYLIKEKDINKEKYKKDTDNEIEVGNYKLYKGKSEKRTLVKNRVVLCDDCQKKYFLKYKEKKCEHKYVCKFCNEELKK